MVERMAVQSYSCFFPLGPDVYKRQRNGHVTVHLDAEQAGVGTATCGPGVQPQYRVPVTEQSFEFTLRTVK